MSNHQELKLAVTADPEEGLMEDNGEGITRLGGMLHGASTILSQTELFHNQFENVMQLLQALVSMS